MKHNKIDPCRREALLLGQMLDMHFPVDQQLLGAMILGKSIGMIAGPRGCGKSFLSMFIAYAIAAELWLSPWGKGAGAKVVILDGEMRAAGLQERLQLTHNRISKAEAKDKAAQNLFIINRDCFGHDIGAIDTLDGVSGHTSSRPNQRASAISLVSTRISPSR